jgi:23S rRNA (guanosine2251-2'-O)-methyltransferase
MSEMLYGRHSVHEALRAGRRRIRRLLLAEGIQPAPVLRQIQQLAESRRIPTQVVPKRALFEINPQHQGVAAEAGSYPYVEFEVGLAAARGQPQPLVLALDCLQDPQNLGTLLRTAEAAGVALVVMPERRQAEVTPAVSHASAGAVEHLQVAQVVNLRRALEQMQQAGLFVYGLEHLPGSQPLWQARLTGPTAIVVGSEGEGLRRLTRETCDALVDIPMYGRVDSLNAAVAGSLLLYEALRQRQASRP